MHFRTLLVLAAGAGAMQQAAAAGKGQDKLSGGLQCSFCKYHAAYVHLLGKNPPGN